ncbi:hypothetical protein Tco_0753479 [Tanacetum coccineum]
MWIFLRNRVDEECKGFKVTILSIQWSSELQSLSPLNEPCPSKAKVADNLDKHDMVLPECIGNQSMHQIYIGD